MQWVMVQMASIGPMLGQFNHFQIFPKEREQPTARTLHARRARLYRLIDDRLAARDWIAGDAYSIADIATYPWATISSGTVSPRLSTRRSCAGAMPSTRAQPPRAPPNGWTRPLRPFRPRRDVLQRPRTWIDSSAARRTCRRRTIRRSHADVRAARRSYGRDLDGNVFEILEMPKRG